VSQVTHHQVRARTWISRHPAAVRYCLLGCALASLIVGAMLSYFYISFSEIIDARLHGERERSLPRVYARPLEVRRGETLSVVDLVARLNDLGYAQRPAVQAPGEFAIVRNAVFISPRSGTFGGKTIRAAFPAAPAVRRAAGPPPAPPRGITALEVISAAGKPVRTEAVTLDAPLLTALMAEGAREKRRRVSLTVIPKRMQDAVLAIEDQSYYSHPGVNPFSVLRSILVNAFGSNRYPVGGSTITQQLARMFFLTDEFNNELSSGTRSYRRKLQEAFMSLVLERRASKDEILELYLNDVYLGQRGSFAIHGVAEAARLFFGKDVANLTVGEAALIAGVIQNPGLHSPFVNPKNAVERRNVVLRTMADEEYITAEVADRAIREPLQIAPRGVDNEAPYFVDMVGQRIAEQFPGLTAQANAVSVHTTLDINLQRLALDAVRDGLAHVDEMLARRRRKGRAQAALVAVDPQTGEILAMVGGRSYNQSQYNRATTARRQPGSVFKPFVYLAAFEQGAEEGRTDLTPASLTNDAPEVFTFDNQTWEPKNYDDYDGEITWRRALAMSRNLGTIHVGATIGFDKVAEVWKRVGVGTPPQGYPAITLGVFELTPLEVAEAYTVFTNAGEVHPLKSIDAIDAGERRLMAKTLPLRHVARPDTTYLVTNMMRSVLNEGTGAGARAAGFTLNAAGKSGTTNDLRDAWFVGFTPHLLTVVWVGFDDNQPVSLSGSQAALPIWTQFMKSATAGELSDEFEVPEGITFAQIDRNTGKLAVPGCPNTINESFLAGTEPTEYCELHR
jgi:penicillin-binding protein 1B